MPKPATAMPATSATTTIFRWVERSAECNEWFISASRRLYRRLIGHRSIPRLFHDGFVDSPKWFHRTSRWPGDAGQWPSGMAGRTLSRHLVDGGGSTETAFRRKPTRPGNKKLGSKENENTPQGFAQVRFRHLGNHHPQQTCQRCRRIRVQAWRQYAG